VKANRGQNVHPVVKDLRRFNEAIQSLEFVIDGDAQSLEGRRCWMNLLLSCYSDGLGNQVSQLFGGLERFPSSRLYPLSFGDPA